MAKHKKEPGFISKAGTAIASFTTKLVMMVVLWVVAAGLFGVGGWVALDMLEREDINWFDPSCSTAYLALGWVMCAAVVLVPLALSGASFYWSFRLWSVGSEPAEAH